MKAKLPTTEVSNGRNLSRDKELVQTYNLIAHKNNELREVITVRCWMGRSRTASTVYATIWVHGPDCWVSGHGQAGGYGYHKISAAVADAIRSAGIELDQSISGVGEQGIRAAMEAIALKLGYKKTLIIEN